MVSDFWLVVQWWGTLFLVGAAAFPLTKKLFGGMEGRGEIREREERNGWWDGGYFFSKAVGMAAVTWMVYVMGTVKAMPFTQWSITFALGIVFLLGIGLHRGKKGRKRSALVIVLEEIFFFAALLLWSWVKGHEPSIRGLEKFMDFGFMQSILNSQYFPPADMWYAGLPINYYYFGHMVVAVLTKLSGIDLIYTFNLMLATIFALTLTMSFSIGVQLSAISRQPSAKLKAGSWKLKALFSGLLTAFLVTLAGNMQTIYAFTRGYTGDDVKPFWQLWWKIGPPSSGLAGLWGVKELWEKIGQGMQTYWYANATRFIPFSIHEFPSYSFVVSDVHGHVLSIPFVLLAIGMLIQLSAVSYQLSARLIAVSWKLMAIFYGFLVGVLLMTNALDGPIYFALFILVFVILRATPPLAGESRSTQRNVLDFARTIVPVLVVAALTSLPFLFHFKSFVTGIAVNCPPAFLANTKFGPLLFEGVEKCQKSPLWMLWILWGFFVYCGVGLIAKLVKFGKLEKLEKILLVFFFFSIGLIIFPEFFYFKDIYPMHFRSNTMFKLGYQAFILFSIVSGYSIVSFLSGYSVSSHRKFSIFNFQFSNKKILFFVLLLPQLFLVSIFPIFSVRSYFNGLKKYEGLYGLNWMQKEYPDDYRVMIWLNSQVTVNKQGSPTTPGARGAITTGLPVIIEADGDSYTDYARFSVFTGIPTIIGWGVHEWLWRGSYDAVAPRRTDVQQVYESDDPEATRTILTRFGVRYVIVGTLERQKYPNLAEWKLAQLGTVAFQQGQTTIYRVDLK